MAIFNVSYSIVTPESADHGDYSEHGVIVAPSDGFSLKDAIDEATKTRTNLCGGIESVDAYLMGDGAFVATITNGAEFETGASETRTLFIQGITPVSARRLARLFGVKINF
jgi:hypothetical protein